MEQVDICKYLGAVIITDDAESTKDTCELVELELRCSFSRDLDTAAAVDPSPPSDQSGHRTSLHRRQYGTVTCAARWD